MSPSHLSVSQRMVLGALIMKREVGIEDRTVESSRESLWTRRRNAVAEENDACDTGA